MLRQQRHPLRHRPRGEHLREQRLEQRPVFHPERIVPEVRVGQEIGQPDRRAEPLPDRLAPDGPTNQPSFAWYAW